MQEYIKKIKVFITILSPLCCFNNVNLKLVGLTTYLEQNKIKFKSRATFRVLKISKKCKINPTYCPGIPV